MEVVVLVEVTVEVEVVVNTVKVDEAVKVGVAVVVVMDVIMVVGGGVVTAAGPMLPIAGGLNHESRTTTDAINSRNVIVEARNLRIKEPTS